MARALLPAMHAVWPVTCFFLRPPKPEGRTPPLSVSLTVARVVETLHDAVDGHEEMDYNITVSWTRDQDVIATSSVHVKLRATRQPQD